MKIHYDTSISSSIPLESATWYHRKVAHDADLSHWSDPIQKLLRTHWKNQYAETSSFEKHETLIKRGLIHKTIPTGKELKEGDIVFPSVLETDF